MTAKQKSLSHKTPYRIKAFLIPLLILLSYNLFAVSIYVSPNGKDKNVGDITTPIQSIEEAVSRIRTIKKEKKAQSIELIFREGTYFLDTTLVLSELEGGEANLPIAFRAYPNEKVVFSGGRLLKKWKKVKGESSNVWKLKVPKALAIKHNHFRQLFLGDQRLPRAKSPNEGYYLTAGPNSASSDAGNWGWFDGITSLRKRKDKKVLDAFCSFSYQGEDLKPWEDIYSAELQVFGCWEASWVSIKSIDTEKKDVWFNTPMRYPVGFFNAKNIRYIVENTKEAMDMDNEWYYNKETKELYIQLPKGQNPNELQVIASHLDELVHIEGEKQKVGHISFEQIVFSHSKRKVGEYGSSQGIWMGDWPAPALEIDPHWPTDFPPGFCGGQTASNIGAALHIENAQYIRFDSCAILNVGNYGINIAEKNAFCSLTNSELYHCGGGGVMLGVRNGNPKVKEVYPAEDVSHHTVIVNNKIHHNGTLFPAAVAINMAQTHHNTIAHNDIHHCSYSGISTGSGFGFFDNYTSYNVFYANKIHKIGQLVNDGGGFYNLGVALGSVLKNNYITDCSTLPPHAVGAGLYGLYFDEGSSLYHIENNVVRNVASSPLYDKGYHCYLKNDLNKKDEQIRMKDVCTQAGINPHFNVKELPKDWFDQYPFIGVESDNWPYTSTKETHYHFSYTNYAEETLTKEYHWDTHNSPHWHISSQSASIQLKAGETKAVDFQIQFTGNPSQLVPIPSLQVVMKDQHGKVFSNKTADLFDKHRMPTLSNEVNSDTKQTFGLWHFDRLHSPTTLADAVSVRAVDQSNTLNYKEITGKQGKGLKLAQGKFDAAVHFDGGGYLESNQLMSSDDEVLFDFWINKTKSHHKEFQESLFFGPSLELRIHRHYDVDRISLIAFLEKIPENGNKSYTMLEAPYKPDCWNHVVAKIEKGKISLEVFAEGDAIVQQREKMLYAPRKKSKKKIWIGKGYTKLLNAKLDEVLVKTL